VSDRWRPSALRSSTAFDPSMVAAELSGILVVNLKRASQGLPMRKNTPKRLKDMGLIKKRGPDMFSDVTEKGKAVLDFIEAQKRRKKL
jgi:hypothetical protein